MASDAAIQGLLYKNLMECKIKLIIELGLPQLIVFDTYETNTKVIAIRLF